MHNNLRRNLVVTLTCILSLLTRTADAASLAEQFGKLISDDEVKITLRVALANIHKLDQKKCTFCGPATAEELTTPPISLSDGRSAMAQGVVRAWAQHCGLEKKAEISRMAFIKFMKERKFTPRQIALLGIMEGIRQKRELETFLGEKPCSDKLRATLNAELP